MSRKENLTSQVADSMRQELAKLFGLLPDAGIDEISRVSKERLTQTQEKLATQFGQIFGERAEMSARYLYLQLEIFSPHLYDKPEDRTAKIACQNYHHELWNLHTFIAQAPNVPNTPAVAQRIVQGFLEVAKFYTGAQNFENNAGYPYTSYQKFVERYKGK